MPTFKGQVSEDDLIRLVEFIKSLKARETPPRVEESTPPALKEPPEKEKSKTP
jgi:hypothetical protein